MSSESPPWPKESGAAASTNAAGIIFGKFGLLTSLVLLVVAAWAGLTVVVISMGLVLSAAGLSRLWCHFSLRGVSCQRHLSDCRLFPDESLELKITVNNRKLLPLPWLTVNDQLPSGFVVAVTVETGSRHGFDLITRSTSILWYSSVSWKYRLVCKKRGYYRLGPLTVSSGDIFGFYPRTAVQIADDCIIVYPKIFTINDILVPSLFPMGGEKSVKPIYEDPSRLDGIRDYDPRDSLKRIHWKASARRGQLQVKVFEPTSTLKAGIFIAIDSFQDNGIWRNDYVELGISAAASLANYLNEKNCQIGFWTNSRLADSGQPARIPICGGTDQLVQVLEGLAKIVSIASCPFMEFFQNERQEIHQGTTIIFVIHKLPDNFVEMLVNLKESGYKVMVLQVGDAAPMGLSSEIARYSIQQAGEIKGVTTAFQDLVD